MANYGDVALGLGANWNRNNYGGNAKFMNSAVGHSDGVSDAYLTDESDKRHQFRWVNPRDRDEITEAKMNGYAFVTKSDWTVNELLWEWTAEDKVMHADLLLMARDGARWIADNKTRESIFTRAHKDDRDGIDNVPDGLVALDAKGQAKRGRPRKGI